MTPFPQLSSVLAVLACLQCALCQAVKTFTLELSHGRWAPDGVERDLILVNGEFPAPMLEISQGDDVVVEVFNGLDEPTSIHFHGIEMRDTPWSDGVPGLSQRPVPPGERFTYRWKATQYGSYWYHSHSHQQIEDGLFGPLTIHPRPDTPKPFGLISESRAAVRAMEKAAQEVRHLLVSDHRHVTGREAWDLTKEVGFDPSCWDSILINGKGSVRCLPEQEAEGLLSADQRVQLDLVNGTLTDKGCYPAKLLALAFGVRDDPPATPGNMLKGCHETDAPGEVIEVRNVSSCDGGNWIAFHIIGALHGISAMVSIDEHPMWVFAVDGGYITPQQVHVVPITNGERVSVLIKADRAGDFTIRVAATTDPQIISGYAKLRVRNSLGKQQPGNNTSTPYIDYAGRPLSGDVAVLDPTGVKPFPPMDMPRVPDETLILHMGNGVPAYLWALNATPLSPVILENKSPLLLQPRPSGDHIVTTTNDTWVDIVLITHSSPNPAHPIHKHGVKMHLLGMGLGPWTWASVEEAARDMPSVFNFDDPPLKDTFTSLKVGPGGSAWMAVRYHSRNPGAWLLHCHVLGHLVGGMQVVLLDGMDVWPEMPEEYRQLAERPG